MKENYFFLWGIFLGLVMQRELVEKDKFQIYSSQERVRRDNTIWTLVQGILAPIQFIVFIVSLFFVIRYLITDQGYELATISIIIKTFFLYLIMITGAIWEKIVFGRYLLAKSFFWEDIVSFFVIALHTIYLVALFTNFFSNDTVIVIALIAYFAYVINALQFFLKFKLAKVSKFKDISSSEGVVT